MKKPTPNYKNYLYGLNKDAHRFITEKDMENVHELCIWFSYNPIEVLVKIYNERKNINYPMIEAVI